MVMDTTETGGGSLGLLNVKDCADAFVLMLARVGRVFLVETCEGADADSLLLMIAEVEAEPLRTEFTSKDGGTFLVVATEDQACQLDFGIAGVGAGELIMVSREFGADPSVATTGSEVGSSVVGT